MAKRKRKDQVATHPTGDTSEPQTPSPADLAGPQDAGAASGEVVKRVGTAEPKAVEPSRAGPPAPAVRKPRGVLGRYFRDRRVQLIDDGNAGGVGIKLTYDDPAERPSEAVKQILKEGDEKRPGFTYRGDLKEWRKRIGADADPRTAVAIRLDAERRVEAIAELMTHEERLKAERDGDGKAGGPTPS